MIRDDEIYSDNDNIIRITTKFYKNLFTSEGVNEKIQHRLLNNVKTKLSKEERAGHERPITENEVRDTMDGLRLGKSPGLDG